MSRTGNYEWQRKRRRILRRSTVCHVCNRLGSDEVDHIIPVMDGGTDDESNLAPIHRSPCHVMKTTAEQRRFHAGRPTRRRPAERHPGSLG